MIELTLQPEVPPIRYFKRPPMFPFIVPAGVMLLAWFFCAYAPGALADACRAWIDRVLGRYTLTITGWFAAVMHFLLEPAYMASQLRKHDTPARAGLKWILWTVLFGFGAIDAFWECGLYEKVRHVYKQTDVGDIGPNVPDEVEVTAEKKTQ